MGKLLRFVKNCSPYVAGDIAGVKSDSEARRLLALEVAVEHNIETLPTPKVIEPVNRMINGTSDRRAKIINKK